MALHLEKQALIGGHDVNGASGSKGTFATTWFWLTDALQRIGRTAHLGNTPQVFSRAKLDPSALTLRAINAPISIVGHWRNLGSRL